RGRPAAIDLALRPGHGALLAAAWRRLLRCAERSNRGGQMRRFSVRNLGFLLLIGVASWLAAAAQAAETSILQEVLRRGTVRIAVNTGNEPRQFVDEKGELQGYDIDI